ncbi:acyl-CoA dehydrogenase family protein [Streptomyces sp. NPDC091267]|uniref:acyl-CoA dehydrogenase family protein n=1 Tax=Streptomyces sp. NPDC091267 TaxID=3155195 RepID=UPI00341DBB6D
MATPAVSAGFLDARTPAPPTPPAPPSSGFRQKVLLHAAAVAGRAAGRAHRERRLSATAVAALDEAGFARHFVPHRWGGREGSFSDVLTAAATVAQGCTSAAWCAVLWAAHGRFASFLPHAAQAEIWGTSPDARIAAALASTGSARAAGDGWVLEGEWSPVSGVDHADWVLLAARMDEALAASRTGLFAVPRGAVEVRDTWNSAGMRGTGSHTVVVRDTFVPEHGVVDLHRVLAGEGPAGGARCRTAPAHLAGGLMFAAPALGAARAALKDWTAWAVRDGEGGARPLNSPGIPELLAQASADIDAVELLFNQAAERADTADVDSALVALNRRDAAVGAARLAGAVDSLLQPGAARSGEVDGALQQRRRDVLTIASHGALRLGPAATAYALALTPQDAADPEAGAERERTAR